VSAAKSEVSEKCEPSEKNSRPSWPKKNAMPAEKSNGGSWRRARRPMSYRWVNFTLGGVRMPRLLHQIRIFRMLGDIPGDEGAERHHLETLRARDVKQS